MKFSFAEKKLVKQVLEKVCGHLSGKTSRDEVEPGKELLWEKCRIGFVYLVANRLSKLQKQESLPRSLHLDLAISFDVKNELSGLDLGDMEEEFSSLVRKVRSSSLQETTYYLSLLYGIVLDHNLCRADDYYVFLSNYNKRQSGSFFTHPKLASELVSSVVAHLVQGKSASQLANLKLIDPSCGPGIFLVTAYFSLAEVLDGDIQNSVESKNSSPLNELSIPSMIYGVDIDPASVLLARTVLWLSMNSVDPELIVSRVRVGDALVGASIDHKKIEGKGNGISKLELDKQCTKLFYDSTEMDMNKSKIQRRFFHWAYEYPHVFDSRQDGGFDAVIGNPPWEIGKPNSREFFSRYIPNYYELGKQKALQQQNILFESNPNVFDEWNHLNLDYKNFSKWIKSAPLQFDSQTNGFQYQGKGDVNLYKCFIEKAYYLTRQNGLISMIVPAGIYCDSGSKKLRELFLDKCNWISLTGFENMDRTFAIHRSFKYCVFIIQKGKSTKSLSTSFLNRSMEESSRKTLVTSFPVDLIQTLSPRSKILLEVESSLALGLLAKIYSSSQYLGDTIYDDCSLNFTREFDMTLDSDKFVGQDDLNDENYHPDEYGNWLKGNWHDKDNGIESVGNVVSLDRKFKIELEEIEEVFIPLYEGRMVGQFDSSKKRWIEGKGRRAVWTDVTSGEIEFGPQYLVSLNDYQSAKTIKGLKTGYLAVGSDTNRRTMIASCLNNVACGNAVPVMYFDPRGTETDSQKMIELQLVLTALLNSFVYDFTLRRRMAGNNLNYFVLDETPLPKELDLNSDLVKVIVQLSAYLNFQGARFCEPLEKLAGMKRSIRLSTSTRDFVRAVIDTLVLDLYNLDFDDLALMLDGFSLVSNNEKLVRSFEFNCDIMENEQIFSRLTNHLISNLDSDNSSLESALSSMKMTDQYPPVFHANPKGFWRIDRDKEFINRHTTLTLLMTKLKESIGAEEFLTKVAKWVDLDRAIDPLPNEKSMKEHATTLNAILTGLR